LTDSIITLTTDFGTSDHLVGAMKGVIANINPAARVVDINHHVTPFDILDGALSIGGAYSYFPARTVHIVIVDPGVGTQRRPLMVSGEKQFFIAPDNGVLSTVYDRESCSVRHITSEHYFLNPVSPTFHGRDIFAPAAAWLSKTAQTEPFGEVVTDFVRFKLPTPKEVNNTLKGVVLRVDTFGNLMTNFKVEHLPPAAVESCEVHFSIAGKEVRDLVRTFGLGGPGQPVALIGSSGYIEIAINRGNAARALGANRGAEVTLLRA
jgi:S-adenosylmethionine hydrolase